MKEYLKQLLFAFEKEILRANSCIHCYFDMKYKNDRNSEWESVYEIAPAFFGLAIRGLQTEALMTVSKLYEPEGRADYSLYKLLSYIQGNAKNIIGNDYAVLNDEVTKYKKSLDEKKVIADKVLHIRDKIIAHNDKDYFPPKIEGKASNVNLSYEEIVDLLKFAEELVNAFNYIVFRSTSVMTYNNGWLGKGHDVDQLMTFCLENLHKNAI